MKRASNDDILTGIISIERFFGDRARTIKVVRLPNMRRADLVAAVEAVRAGLPSDCGASLLTPDGRNIHPAAEG